MPEGPKNYEPPIEGKAIAELPPDFARYRNILLELQDDIVKLREIIEKNKDKPAMIFATQIADIPENLVFLSGILTDHLESLNQGQLIYNRKQFAAELNATFGSRLLRADALLQTYVLPAIDPPQTEAQDFANIVHQLTEKLRKGVSDSLGVVFDDIQLMTPPQPDSEGYSRKYGEVARWVPFVQCYKTHPTEIRQMVVRMYKNIRKELAPFDPILKKAKQEGTTGTLDVEKYRRVTDVLMWGYTQDGIREVPTEVTINTDAETLDFITRHPE